MDKGQEMPQLDSTVPSAPPSYEEAIAQSGFPPNLPRNPPYPTGGPQMPMPTPFVPQREPAPITRHDALFNDPYRTQWRAQEVFTPWTLGPNAVKLKCPNCHTNVKTTIVSDHQPSAHICCIILCLLGCCLCSCLPYCMTAFLSVHHFCPNCKACIGTWKG